MEISVYTECDELHDKIPSDRIPTMQELARWLCEFGEDIQVRIRVSDCGRTLIITPIGACVIGQSDELDHLDGGLIDCGMFACDGFSRPYPSSDCPNVIEVTVPALFIHDGHYCIVPDRGDNTAVIEEARKDACDIVAASGVFTWDPYIGTLHNIQRYPIWRVP